MNSAEGREILARKLAPYREHSYEQLCDLVGDSPRVCEATGPSGAIYQIEVGAHWDGKPHGNVLVIGSIDDGRWRAFLPLNMSFIKAQDGSFLGE